MADQTATGERLKDARQAVWQQLAALYRGLSPVQRVLVVAAGLAVGVGLTWVSLSRSENGYVAIRNGRTFRADELTAARKELAAAGLTEFRVEERRILAPAAAVAQYDAALAVDEPDEAGWAGAWRQANDSLTPFATSRQQQDAREIARARLISEMLTQLPDVAQAEIVWDEEPRVGWRQPPKVRATVYVRPREQREITLDVVEAVKQAVAGSKAHLDAADIVVLDLQRMVAYRSGRSGDETSADQQRLAVITAAYRQRIEDALADVEGVRVAVVVEPTEAGIPAEPRARRETRELPTESATPDRTGDSGARPPLRAAGGPNVRLEVPRFVPTPGSESASAPPAARIATSRPDDRRIGAERAAAERVSVTIALAPEYLRRQAEARHTVAVFARMSPVQQQALLADIERGVGRTVRERVAAIIPGESLEDRLARVQVVPQPGFVAEASDTAPAGPSTGFDLPEPSGTAGTAQWVIVGMMVCLGSWILYQIARAVRGRRDSQSIAPRSGQRPVLTAPDSVTDRVAELLASLEGADADGWAHQAAGESPQVIAALLKSLPAERVGDVLAGLSAEVQREVLALLAGAHSAAPAAGAVLQPVLRRNAGPRVERGVAEVAPRNPGWFQRRRRGKSDLRATEWNETETMAPEEASDLDQIIDLDPGLLRLRYGELPVDVWSTALMGASSAFRVRLLSALAAAEAAALRQALTRQRPARLSEIERAQSQVLALLNGRAPVAAVSA